MLLVLFKGVVEDGVRSAAKNSLRLAKVIHSSSTGSTGITIYAPLTFYGFVHRFSGLIHCF